MLPDGALSIRGVSCEEAAAWLNKAPFHNAANPNHGNTLAMLSALTGVELRQSAQGGKVALMTGDSCLVSEVLGLPRVTREFTDTEVAAATVRLRVVQIG